MRINTALMPALLFMLLVFVALMGAFVGDGADQKEKLRIGVIAPLSGVAAEYGAAISNGITLAQAELPAVHERIEFLFEDTPYASKAAVSSFQKLRTADRVDAVYVMGVSFCDAVAPLAESAKLPMIAQCVQRSVTAGRNFVLRFFSPADKYAQAVIYYLKAQGLNRLGVVIAGNTYVEEMLRALIENALPSQEITTIARYQAEDTDFRAAITKIKHSQYDAIAVLLNAGQIASFYRQLAEQEVTLPTIGTNWFETESEIQAAGGTMENAVYANNIVRDDFTARYQAHFSTTSQITFAAFAYEFAKLAAQAAQNRGADAAPGGLIEQISRLRLGPESAVGAAEFMQTPQSGKAFDFAVSLKQIQDGRPRVISADNPAL